MSRSRLFSFLSFPVVALGVAEVSILLMLVIMRRRVKLAVALLREASKYVHLNG